MIDGLTSSQRGRIAELHLATALMAHSGGRLSPFAPLSDDHGVDLVVFDKATAVSLPVQVKSWFLAPERPVKTVRFDVQTSTFSSEGRGAVVCLLMDPATLTMLLGWVFPVRVIPSLSNAHKRILALTPSRMETTSDRYVSYRHSSLALLTAEVERLMTMA